MIASGALELGKRGFATYLLEIPTYKAVDGGIAVFPAFLPWVYFSWLVTLAAARIAANLTRTGTSLCARRGVGEGSTGLALVRVRAELPTEVPPAMERRTTRTPETQYKARLPRLGTAPGAAAVRPPTRSGSQA